MLPRNATIARQFASRVDELRVREVLAIAALVLPLQGVGEVLGGARVPPMA